MVLFPLNHCRFVNASCSPAWKVFTVSASLSLSFVLQFKSSSERDPRT